MVKLITNLIMFLPSTIIAAASAATQDLNIFAQPLRRQQPSTEL
jgi:hypothetical protein